MMSACGTLDASGIVQPLAPQLPPRFVHAAGADRPTTATAAQFWRQFGAPELVDLIGRAEAGSFDLAAAIARMEQAQAASDLARTALFPSGSAQGSDTLSRASANASGVPSSLIKNQRLYSAGFTASYEIDFWGKTAAAIRSADDSANAGIFARDTVRLSLTAQTALTYFAIMSLRDRLRIARQNIDVAVSVAATIRAGVEAGSATDIDLAQQEAIVLQQKAAVPVLERSMEESEIALAVLIGDVPGPARTKGTGLGSLAIPRQAVGVPTDLLRRRPDVHAAEENVLAAAENVTAARAAMLPSITLSLQAGFASPILSTLISPASGLYQIVGGVAQPLLDLPRLQAQLRQTEYRRAELVANYRGAVLASIGDVETALADLKSIGIQVRIEAAAAEKAKKAYELSSAQMAAGQIDLVTLLSTQRVYFQALDTLQQTRLLQFDASVALYKALGGGWTVDEPNPSPACSLRRAADSHASGTSPCAMSPKS